MVTTRKRTRDLENEENNNNRHELVTTVHTSSHTCEQSSDQHQSDFIPVDVKVPFRTDVDDVNYDRIPKKRVIAFMHRLWFDDHEMYNTVIDIVSKRSREPEMPVAVAVRIGMCIHKAYESFLEK